MHSYGAIGSSSGLALRRAEGSAGEAARLSLTLTLAAKFLRWLRRFLLWLWWRLTCGRDKPLEALPRPGSISTLGGLDFMCEAQDRFLDGRKAHERRTCHLQNVQIVRRPGLFIVVDDALLDGRVA